MLTKNAHVVYACRFATQDGMSQKVRSAYAATASTPALQTQQTTTPRPPRRACPAPPGSRCPPEASARASLARPAARTTTASRPPPARCAGRATASAGRA